MCLNHPELSERFDVLKQPRTSAKSTLHTCDGVVNVGSMRFTVLEQPCISAKAPYTPCYLCAGVDRVGSMDVITMNGGSPHSNLSEPLHRLSKEQREQSNRGSTHANLSEPLRRSAQTEQAAVSVV